jgi:phosphatidylglycerophosphate synthase
VRRDEEIYLAGWSRTHDGVEVSPSSLAGRWLLLMAHVARPLARRGVPPAAITAAAVLCAAVTCLLVGDRWLLPAVAVAASGVFDGLDGAVALLSGRDSACGYLLDSVADRVGDGLLLLAMWLAGGHPAAVLTAAAAVVLLEYTRARSAAAGLGLTVVTVGERATRLIVIAMTFVSAAVVGHVVTVVTAGAVVLAVVAAVGWLQLMLVARRAVVLSGATDHLRDDRGGHRDQRDAAARMGRPTDEEQAVDR